MNTTILILFWITLLGFMVYTYFYIDEVTTSPCTMCEREVQDMVCVQMVRGQTT